MQQELALPIGTDWWSGSPANFAARTPQKKPRPAAPRPTTPARLKALPLALGEAPRSEAPRSSRGAGQEAAAEFAVTQMDAVDWLASLREDSVDLIITDPPYESLEKHRAVGTTTRLKQSKGSSNPWFQIFPNTRFPELFHQAYRVLRPHRHLYLFCDQETLFIAKPAAEAAGFKFWKPLVWDKQTIGMGYHYRSRYEFILFFEKGKRKLHDLGIADVLSEPRIRSGYPTEKPVALSETLVRQSTDTGMLVIDPFSGSGSAGVAAVKNGRSFLGNDLSSEAVEVTARRLIEAGATPSQDLYRRHCP